MHLLSDADRAYLSELVELKVRQAVEKLLPKQKAERLTQAEFCQRYGVSEATAIRWRKEEGLPFKALGARIFYDLDDIETWMVTSARARQARKGCAS